MVDLETRHDISPEHGHHSHYPTSEHHEPAVHHEHREHHTPKGFKPSILMVSLVVAAIILIAAFWFLSSGFQSSANELRELGLKNADAISRLSVYGSLSQGPQIEESVLKKRVEDYLNKNFLEPRGTSASIKRVEEKLGMYQIWFDVIQGGQVTQEGAVYASKDGKLLLVGEVFDLTAPLPVPSPQPTATPPTQNFSKTEKPIVKMFVMTFCPFGQQAEKGLLPVARLFGDKISIEPHYVIYDKRQGYSGATYCIADDEYCSMHGIKELNEGVRQLCINKYEPEKFWDYVEYVDYKCALQDIESCWEKAAESAGVDKAKVEKCFEEEAETLLSVEKQLNDDYGVSGSPTVFINEGLYSGGRSPEDYKQAICNAFETPPEECSQTLESDGSAAAGQC